MQALVDIEETIHVDATPDAVWQLITDVRRHPEYAGPKSITKVIDFDDTLHVGARWIAHEKFGPQKFDAPSEVTTWVPDHNFGWVSFPPMKEANRGEGGRVFWSYTVTPELDGTRLTHHMEVLPPAKGAWTLKTMYAVLRLPAKQRRGIRTTLANIKSTAEHT
ncbi:carbon monoxide dehydrogenase subunit G [Kribbella sp. VKM Ac-2569]|uniref:SRPBCC family protein n=1 Tax=Kribbella sp. VKM Ac-2569 TaxID=2512220 RepID=UPI0010DDD1A1|nr:SRPBCC family protein [Kribbella sp. VKM Ac-2569]RZT27284.1 carbon monoxide dehydrogenase subunit G [Kribbella sp. VKM Ac-2569]